MKQTNSESSNTFGKKKTKPNKTGKEEDNKNNKLETSAAALSERRDWPSAGRPQGKYWLSPTEPCLLSAVCKGVNVCACASEHIFVRACVSEGPSQHGAARTFGPQAVS